MNLSLFKWWPQPFPRENNSQIVKIHWSLFNLFFSRNNWVSLNQTFNKASLGERDSGVFLNEETCLFSKGIVEKHWPLYKINQTNVLRSSLGLNGFRFDQIKKRVLYSDIGKIHWRLLKFCYFRTTWQIKAKLDTQRVSETWWPTIMSIKAHGSLVLF